MYLDAFRGVHEGRKVIGLWLAHYNQKRADLSFNGLKPDEVYYWSAKIRELEAVEKALEAFPELNNSDNDDYPTILPELCRQNS